MTGLLFTEDEKVIKGYPSREEALKGYQETLFNWEKESLEENGY